MRVCAQWYGQGGGSRRLPRAAIKRGGKNGDDKGELLGAVKLQSAPDADNPCYVAVCVNCFEWHCYTDGSYSKYTIHRTGVNVCHAASNCQINKKHIIHKLQNTCNKTVNDNNKCKCYTLHRYIKAVQLSYKNSA